MKIKAKIVQTPIVTVSKTLSCTILPLASSFSDTRALALVLINSPSPHRSEQVT